MVSTDLFGTDPKIPLHEDDDCDEEDETLAERLYGLTEMFPESVRNFSYNSTICLKKCMKGAFNLSCSLTWMFFSSSTILFAPLLFEIERAQLQNLQRNQQKQVLLGPNTAISSGAPMPQMPMGPMQG